VYVVSNNPQGRTILFHANCSRLESAD
jgi:hypothetical protein